MVYPRIEREDVAKQEHQVHCEEHGCWKFKDMYGHFVCIVCLVEDRIS